MPRQGGVSKDHCASVYLTRRGQSSAWHALPGTRGAICMIQLEHQGRFDRARASSRVMPFYRLKSRTSSPPLPGRTSVLIRRGGARPPGEEPRGLASQRLLGRLTRLPHCTRVRAGDTDREEEVSRHGGDVLIAIAGNFWCNARCSVGGREHEALRCEVHRRLSPALCGGLRWLQHVVDRPIAGFPDTFTSAKRCY